MKPIENAIYNESKNTYKPIPEGTYPAHISKFESKEYNGAYVFNVTFKVAEEAKDIEFAEQQKDNNGKLVPTGASVTGVQAVGKEYRTDKGIWLTPNLSEENSWKNKRYAEFFASIGMAFGKDSNGNMQLQMVEESDVMGLPCLVQLVNTEFKNADGETRSSLKVGKVYKWEDGERISSDELEADDLPF